VYFSEGVVKCAVTLGKRKCPHEHSIKGFSDP
jgi:hypothetical protein